MCELSLAEDLDTRFRAYIANEDPAEVGACSPPTTWCWV